MAKLITLEGIGSTALDKPVVKYAAIAAVGIGALLIIRHTTGKLNDRIKAKTKR